MIDNLLPDDSFDSHIGSCWFNVQPKADNCGNCNWK